MTSLKIDLRNGLLEVEGEETFVREIYQNHKESIMKKIDLPKKENRLCDELDSISLPTENVLGKKENIKKVASKRKGKESYKIIKDLDLATKNNRESLKEFYSKKSPANAMEKNTVFVFYLQNKLGIQEISLNHIYTCYVNLNERIPKALRQSLIDTSARKGWINTESLEKITITVHGENLVNHDLPNQSSEKTIKE
jgi:hypothetical protein